MLLIILTALATFVSLCLAAFYLRRKLVDFRKFGHLPGPSPNWFFGNLLDFEDKNDRRCTVDRWFRKFGPTFIFFEGSKPYVVSRDLDLCYEVCVRKSKHFDHRRDFPMSPHSDWHEDTPLFFCSGERRVRLRKLVAPGFGTGKINGLVPLMQNCQETFLTGVEDEVITKAGRDGINLDAHLKRMTIDTILQCSFGSDAMSTTEGDVLLAQVQTVMDGLFNFTRIPLAVVLQFCVPSLAVALTSLDRWLHTALGIRWTYYAPAKALEDEFRKIKKTYETQKLSAAGSGEDAKKLALGQGFDLLATLLDSQEFQSFKQIPKATTVQEGSIDLAKTGTTEHEIVAQCTMYLSAGYETTATMLHYTIFHLVKYPKIQDRLYTELANETPENRINNPYLTAIVNETFRLFPVGNYMLRTCTQPCQVRGIDFEKGDGLMFDTFAFHNNPDIWGHNPESFDPDRWNLDCVKNRHSASFLIFGLGAMACIGARFAVKEINLTLVNLVMRYRLEAGTTFDDKPEIRCAGIMVPSNPLNVKLIER